LVLNTMRLNTEEEAMLRKALLSITVALSTLLLLVIGITAQSDEEPASPAITVVPNVAAATVTQTVPVTLTLSLPGPTGPVTIEVPIFLSLDIRIGISPELTPTLAVTPSVVTEVDAPSTEVSPEAVDAPAEDPTPTPTAPPAASIPEDVEPTEVPLPTATPTETATPQPVAVAPLCPDPRAVITSPSVNQVVSGTVEIVGTATHQNFLYYKVEYAQGADVNPDSTFAYLADARVQVTDGLLTAFDSANFSNGAYTIKLTVVDNSGNFPPPCTVSVIVTN
jgi:hypothetical protein